MRSLMLVGLLVLLPPVLAQSPLYSIAGAIQSDYLGHSVSDAGDVDGDGYADFIAGSFKGINAEVFSGQTGTVLLSLENWDSHTPVSGAGDVNGDGYPDLIVGGPGDRYYGTGAGRARVYSGLDGGVLYTFYGGFNFAYFGTSVSGAGDVNGDGYSDLLIGAPGDRLKGNSPGSATVFSGLDGAVLFRFFGDAHNIEFGNSVSDAGDVNADGYPDFIAGAKRSDNGNLKRTGSAQVFSGKGGGVLHYLRGTVEGSGFGRSVSGAGDVNGDGYADLIVGTGSGLGGKAQVFSGVNGNSFYDLTGDPSIQDYFGGSVSGAGDVNGDGYSDFIVGARGDDTNGKRSGSARVYSGVNGYILFAYYGDHADDCLGSSVSGAGDVNGDGYVDVIVGASRADTGFRYGGYVRVFPGMQVALAADTHLMSVSTASVQNLSLDAGVENALKIYWIFTNFGVSGNSPGVTFAPGVTVPLNPDALTLFLSDLTYLGGGPPHFVGWRGFLDASGKANATLQTLSPVTVPAGITINHAALVYTEDGCGPGCFTFQLATNAVPMTTVP